MSEIDAILITGPTASGKSALAVELARRHGGAVVNADSMQVYDTLRLLTARPSPEDEQGIPHHLYGHVPAAETYSTGAWLRHMEPLLETLRGQGRLPVIVGGTGLYFKALTGGLAEMPDIPDAVRQAVRARLAAGGPQSLHEELARVDAETARRLQPQDGQRIARALEVFEATGTPLSVLQVAPGRALIAPERARKIVVLPDRQRLAERIGRRFESMLDQGAIEEVQALQALDPAGDLPVMKAIGVPEIIAYLGGAMDRTEVIARATAATRQYAKRQMTWFRNQMDASWQRLDPDAITKDYSNSRI